MAFAVVQALIIFLLISKLIQRVNKKLNTIIIFISLALLIICLTPYLFSGVSFSDKGDNYLPIVEPGIFLFAVVTLGLIFYSILLLIKKYFKSLGIIKNQLRLIILGLIIMYAGIIYFSFINVVVFNNSNYVYLVSFFTLPFIILTTYSILRYRFMDIKVVIKKGVVYGISLIIALSIYTYLVLVFKDTIEDSWNVNTTWTAAILIVLVALGFPPLKNLVEKAVNKLFKGKKSIDLAVAEVKEKISHESNFENLVGIIKKEIKEYLDVDSIQLFVYDKQSGDFAGKNGDTGKSLSQKSSLPKYFNKYDEVLIAEEIPHLLNERQGKFEKEVLQQAEKEMKKNNFNLLMPVKTDQDVIAMVGFSGESKSFSVQDVEYLNKLREQVTFAIANALLYENAMKRVRGEAV